MAYNANIPLATDQLSQSQIDINANFQALKTLIDVNHVDFASADQGKHAKVTFPAQSPAPTFILGEIGLYSFLSPITGVNELYINNSINATNTPFSASAQSAIGWSYLPSGLLVKWGQFTATGVTANNFPIGASIPVFTAVYQAFITTINAGLGDSNTFAQLISFNTTSITAWGGRRTTSAATPTAFTYLVIGK